ncbi:winged helix DNA-binding domain-containing protein, partial [Microstroma glucosiphilum]
MGHYQQLQHRQGSRDQNGASLINAAGRSNLVPGRSNSGTSTSGALSISRAPSPGLKSEAGLPDRGIPSPQEFDKDGDAGGEKRQSNRFVYKLMKMVSDPESQHLISFNPSGTSVVVTNFDDFAKDVLPKHFKHSNFSSFIRQLNMYGFYKVNKTPRGQRNSNDMQVWEFSHPKFIKGRPDLLDEIRRKALDNDHGRGEARDLQFNMSMGQMQLRHHLEEVQWRLDQTMEQ